MVAPAPGACSWLDQLHPEESKTGIMSANMWLGCGWAGAGAGVGGAEVQVGIWQAATQLAAVCYMQGGMHYTANVHIRI